MKKVISSRRPYKENCFAEIIESYHAQAEFSKHDLDLRKSLQHHNKFESPNQADKIVETIQNDNEAESLNQTDNMVEAKLKRHHSKISLASFTGSRHHDHSRP